MCIRDSVQGAFVSDEEVSKVVEFLKEENNAEDSYGADIQEKIQTAAVKAATDVYKRQDVECVSFIQPKRCQKNMQKQEMNPRKHLETIRFSLKNT